MIPAQTILVAVTACVVIVAVWAWGIVREDAANQAGFDAGRLAGAAEERQRARRELRTSANNSARNAQAAPGHQEAPSVASFSDAPNRGRPGALQRENSVPAFLRTPNETEE